MGQPCFYVYPLDSNGVSGTLERVEIPAGKGVAELEAFQVRSRLDARAPDGLARFWLAGAFDQVTIRISGLVKAGQGDFIARLDAMDSALSMGSPCHFSMDRDRTGLWPMVDSTAAAYAVPAQKATTTYHRAGDILSLETAPALQPQDYVVIETVPPEGHRHVGRIIQWGGGVVPMNFDAANAVFFRSSVSQAWVRWVDFYPRLYLTPESLDGPRLRRDGAVAWEWVATFHSEPQALSDLFPAVP